MKMFYITNENMFAKVERILTIEMCLPMKNVVTIIIVHL